MKKQIATSFSWCTVISFALIRIAPAAPATLATSHFNVPPFTAGIPVDGQGATESGWAGPWRKLGGFDDRGHVVTSPTQEGTGAVQIFADQVFGTSIEREWAASTPVVRVDAYVYVTPGASLNGQIVTGTAGVGEIDPRRAGTFQIEPSGLITVFDATMNSFVPTGFHTLPNTWNKYSLIANTNDSTFRFLFNNQLFLYPHPLPFLNAMTYVDGINLRAAGTLTSYVDNITVTAVPEPHTGPYALGTVATWLWSRRRKNWQSWMLICRDPFVAGLLEVDARRV